MKHRSRLAIAGAAAFAVTAALLSGGVHPATAEAAPPSDVFAPIVWGADPSMIRYNGEYWLVQSDVQGVNLRHAPTLAGLSTAAPQTVIAASTLASSLNRDIWAPEIEVVRGSVYIYFSASDGVNENHRMYGTKATTGNLLGAWSAPVKMNDSTNRWAIDGTTAEINGQLYYVWSGWDGATDAGQNTYIAPMSDPLTISGPRVRVSTPTQPWETSVHPIQEGQSILQHNGRTFIIYSANASWTDSYCLASLELTGTNPLDPAQWVKSSGCLMASSPTAYGPGHNGFVKDANGEDLLVYHANTVSGTGWDGRTIRAQHFTWDAAGRPVFATAERADLASPTLGAEVHDGRVTYEAENAALSQARVVTATVQGASGGKKVGYIDNVATSTVTFAVTAPVAGKYEMLVRYSAANGSTATHSLAVNGVAAPDLSYQGRGWDNWLLVSRTVTLKAGANTIRFAHATGFAELDLIQLVPPTAP